MGLNGRVNGLKGMGGNAVLRGGGIAREGAAILDGPGSVLSSFC